MEIYPYSAEYAQENGESDKYIASVKETEACVSMLNEVIPSCYKNNSLNCEKVFVTVSGLYSNARIAYILASTINAHRTDGRISEENRNRARKTANGAAPDAQISNLIHIGLIDLFTTYFRKETML